MRKVTVFGTRLRAKYAATLGDDGCDYLGRMLKASERMQSLINDLLTFSRLTTKAQPFAQVDLNKVAREILGDLETRIEQVGAEVKVGPLPTIAAEPLQMRQLLQNLVGNALKFHRPGVKPAVKIEASLTRDKSELYGRAGQQVVHLKVSDNGIGRQDGDGPPAKGGLGTSLVNALAHQLDAQVTTQSSASGMSVSIAHATFSARATRAA